MQYCTNKNFQQHKKYCRNKILYANFLKNQLVALISGFHHNNFTNRGIVIKISQRKIEDSQQ